MKNKACSLFALGLSVVCTAFATPVTFSADSATVSSFENAVQIAPANIDTADAGTQPALPALYVNISGSTTLSNASTASSDVSVAPLANFNLTDNVIAASQIDAVNGQLTSAIAPVDNSVGTPEPMTIALIGSGLVLLGWRRYRPSH